MMTRMTAPMSSIFRVRARFIGVRLLMTLVLSLPIVSFSLPIVSMQRSLAPLLIPLYCNPKFGIFHEKVLMCQCDGPISSDQPLQLALIRPSCGAAPPRGSYKCQLKGLVRRNRSIALAHQ